MRSGAEPHRDRSRRRKVGRPIRAARDQRDHDGAAADRDEGNGAAAAVLRPVGAVLRELRERRGLTIEAVSMETRIPLAHLRRIEEDRLDELPAEVFLRGFLRAYARAVGADPEAVIRLHETAHGPSQPPKASRWPGVFRIRRRSPLGFLLALLVFAAVVALLVSFVYRE